MQPHHSTVRQGRSCRRTSQHYPVLLRVLCGKGLGTRFHQPPQQPEQTKPHRIQNPMSRGHPRNRQQLALQKIRDGIRSRQRHADKHRPRSHSQKTSRCSILNAPRANPHKPRQPRHARRKNNRRHHLQPRRNHKSRRHHDRHHQHQHHNPPQPSQQIVAPPHLRLRKPQSRPRNHRRSKPRKMKMHRRQQPNRLLDPQRPPPQPRRHQPSPSHRQINSSHTTGNLGKPRGHRHDSCGHGRPARELFHPSSGRQNRRPRNQNPQLPPSSRSHQPTNHHPPRRQHPRAR